MAKKKSTGFDALTAKEEANQLITNFIALAGNDSLREKVLALIPVFRAIRRMGKNIIPEGESVSGRDRILIYLRRYPLTVIGGEELMVVSGISDYPRRIRELRIEAGWPILSGTTVRAMLEEGEWAQDQVAVSHMQTDEYILLADAQDRDAAHRWNVTNQIRKKKISVKDKILAFLRESVGRNVTGEELSYVANGKTEWARRTRELRTEEGWPVKTRQTGRPDLPIGVYILEEDKQAEPHDR